MEITYQTGFMPAIANIIEVYESSGLVRPIEDERRIAQMYSQSNLIVTAWRDQELVGISRAITDFCYCCYLSDLAVRSDHQKQGIGKRLVELTKAAIGERTSLILLAAPEAINYYPKIGMAKIENGFIIKRTQ